MSTAVVVGNPKPKSRTYQAALLIAELLSGAPAEVVVDLAQHQAALIDWTSGAAAGLVDEVLSCDLVVFASPTYKGTYTGLLKLFLDRVGTGAMAGKPAVPLMVGGDGRHFLAPEVFLKPVLAELGASCPTAALFLLETEHAGSEALDRWVERWRPVVQRALATDLPTAR